MEIQIKIVLNAILQELNINIFMTRIMIYLENVILNVLLKLIYIKIQNV
jgi:hypothetical protein